VQTQTQDQPTDNHTPRWRRWIDSLVRNMANADQSWSLYEDLGTIDPAQVTEMCETNSRDASHAPSERGPGHGKTIRLVRKVPPSP
jgi:hypothetical protein